MQNSLLFIPDISGYTKFVRHTEVQHSRHIISELLETLIDANSMGLELVEIEGDALFYYKLDYSPNSDELLEQVRRMYLAFHQYLNSYATRRICPCGACETAVDLKIKFIVHSGPLDFIQVKDITKPYGESVIQAHRALKNSIEKPEYLMLSSSLWNSLDTKPKEENWLLGKDEYDFGNLDYHFLDLLEWKKHLKKEPSKDHFDDKKPDIIVSRDIPVPSKSLFELLSNLEYRMRWTDGIKELKYKKNQVNSSGSTHVCVLKNGTINVESYIERRKNNSLILGELTLDPPVADSIAVLYIVTPLENDKSANLTFEIRLDGKGIFFKLLLPFLKRKLKKSIAKNLDNIHSKANALIEEYGL